MNLCVNIVADPDLELMGGGGGGGGQFFACPTGFSSFCDFFSPKIKERPKPAGRLL